MKTILITGGAGFIGSNFVKRTLANHPDYKVINLDAVTYAGNLENLSDMDTDPRYTFVKGSNNDQTVVDELFAKCDYVVNFAAESHVDRSIEDPDVFVRTNVLGTQTLLNALKRNSHIAKYVQVSTDEVYGSLGATGLFTEETPIAPNSPYSASKAGADLLVRAAFETYGLPVNITRCSNNYGPYQFPEKLIPLMIANAYNDKQLPVYGDGMNIRDWLHVSDHCAAIDAVLFNAKPGAVYNIGGNNEKTNIEIVKLILNALGKPETLIKYVKDRLGHDRRYAIDATKIKRELGFEPAYTFENGMRETIGWYLHNIDWWTRVISGDYKQYYAKMYGNR